MKANTNSVLFPLGRLYTSTKMRTYSTFPGSLRQELIARRLPLVYDYLHPQPSHLLNLTLMDIIPHLKSTVYKHATLPSVKRPPLLKPGHHLVYFPPQVTLSQLLPDGTDTLHFPGQPFTRRLWAGGRVRFPSMHSPRLDGSRAVCIETIRDVIVKGHQGEEKLLVDIERRMGTVKEDEAEESIWGRLWSEDANEDRESSVIENRTLVFMRQKSTQQIETDKGDFEKDRRKIQAPSDAEFQHKIKPTKDLLFRFSALTFNAHSIHLDTSYTRNVEGYPSLLVHGPLTLTLLLTVLQSHLVESNRAISEIEYRNLCPLYVDEDLTICGKPRFDKGNGAWDVWIEGNNGGLAVRGTLKTKECEVSR